MGEYRRFVSYLYGYDGAEKGKNAGFVRVEVRGAQAVIRIGLREAPGEGQAVLLSSGRELVPLGTVRKSAGAGGERFCLKRENVQESGLDFGSFSGLRIDFPASGRRCQTFWDDRVSPGTEFFVRVESEAEEQPTAGARGGEQNAGSDPAEPRETAAGEGRDGIAEGTFGASGGTVTEDTFGASDGKLTEDAFEANGGFAAESEASELAEKTTVQSVTYTEIWREEPRITWEQLQKIYPKCFPFGETDTWEALRIRLQDIGRLPREHWLLGNNDFVVQGYENHHHLLLLRDPAGDLVYLGVPGEPLGQERRVAELFGFRRYRPAEPQGYWLTRIKL